MINELINNIDFYAHSEKFFNKEIESRILTVALTALTPIEAAFKGVTASLCLGVYAICLPFRLLKDIADLSRKKATFGKVLESEVKFLNDWVLKTAAKATITALTILLSPVLGLISPKALVAMHYELGTANKKKEYTSEKIVDPEKNEGDDFTGFEDLLEIYDKYLNVFKNPTIKEYGIKMPAGMIFYGQPGCGKTTAAKYFPAYAKKQGVKLNFESFNAVEVASKWRGEGIQKIDEIYERAILNSPSVLLIDECEGLFPKRDNLGSHGSDVERTQEINVSLKRLEAAAKNKVIVILATNQIEKVDQAVLRTGRIDFKYEVKPPHAEMRSKMIEKKLQIRTKHLSYDIDYPQLGEVTKEFTASDIDSMVNHACYAAWSAKGDVTQEILLTSVLSIAKQKLAGKHPQKIKSLFDWLTFK